MKSLSVEFFLLATTLAGSAIPLFSIWSRKGLSWKIRIPILLIATASALFFGYTFVKTVSWEIFGLELPKFCEVVKLTTCTIGDLQKGSPPTADPLPTVGLTSVEICGRALAADRRSWSADLGPLEFVRKAQEAGETIDTCRLKIGLKSISEADREQETDLVRAMSNKQLCTYAYNTGSKNFTTLPAYKTHVMEALNRGITLADCESALGVAKPSTISSPPESAIDENYGNRSVSKPASSEIDTRTGLPVSFVMNKSGTSSNLRSGPGKNYPAVMRLPNNLEVLVTGSALSATGYQWCEISLRNGKRGFISADLIFHSCELTQTQVQNARKTQELQRQQNEQMTKEMIGLFGSLLKK